MSSIKQFFGSSGSGFLGVKYPKNSTEYKASENISNGLTAGDYYSLSGARLPFALDATKQISIDNSGINVGLSSTKLAQVTWTVSNATLNMNAYASAVWCNPFDDYIYIVSPYDVSGNAVIKKLRPSDGLITNVATVAPSPTPMNTYTDYGVSAYPVDVANPDTTTWEVFFYNISAAVIKSITIDALAQTAIENTANQAVGTIATPWLSYMSADKKIAVSAWTSGFTSLGDRVIGFIVSRGNVRQYVQMPFDGQMPLVEPIIVDWHDFTWSSSFATLGNTEQLYRTRINIFGNSVIFSVIRDTGTSVKKPYLIGRRAFDRSDFDRWLNDICDALNMPAGVPYF